MRNNSTRLYFPQLINSLVEMATAKVALRAGLTINALHEPEITAALVTELPDMVNRVMQDADVNVRLGGCFIHQKPKAHYTLQSGKNTCREVGDLLVVCHYNHSGTEANNATLFQMKMHDVGGQYHTIINPGELEQLELYKHWPEFYCNNQKCSTCFNLYPKSPHQGAQYGLIGRQYPYEPITIYHSLPSREMILYPEQTFGDLIQSLVICQNGRIITPRADQNKDEWSHLVWYLIDICWQSAYKVSRVNYPHQSRIGGDFFNICNFMTNTTIHELDDIKVDFVEDYAEGDDKGWFSLLLIDVDCDYPLTVSRYKNFYKYMEGGSYGFNYKR